MTRSCINLKAEFGRRYRVRYEESYHAQYGRNARVEDPWLMILLCQYGHVYPFGGNTLAVSVDGYPKVAGRLRKLSCVRIHQDGDAGELTVVFDLADFAHVARIMRPRRRPHRNLSEEQKRVIGDRLHRGRQKARQTVVETHQTARPCPSKQQGDPEHVLRQLALFDHREGP